MQPTVAVDLRVLDFVMRLFLNMPPNNTVLTKTLEGYLDSLGYKLDSRVYTYIFTFVRSLTTLLIRTRFDGASEMRSSTIPACDTGQRPR